MTRADAEDAAKHFQKRGFDVQAKPSDIGWVLSAKLRGTDTHRKLVFGALEANALINCRAVAELPVRQLRIVPAVPKAQSR